MCSVRGGAWNPLQPGLSLLAQLLRLAQLEYTTDACANAPANAGPLAALLGAADHAPPSAAGALPAEIVPPPTSPALLQSPVVEVTPWQALGSRRSPQHSTLHLRAASKRPRIYVALLWRLDLRASSQAAVAQLAARRSHNPKVVSSILTCRKCAVWVEVPGIRSSPAYLCSRNCYGWRS